MAVKVLKREYTSLFDQTNQNINWLLGNVGTWQKLTLEVAFSTEIKFSITNPYYLLFGQICNCLSIIYDDKIIT